MMKTITLANQDTTINISRLCVGHEGIIDPKRVEFIHWYMSAYLDAGGNCIDSARLYDNGLGEGEVGKFLKLRRREDVVLVTKCGHYDRGTRPIVHRLAPEDILSDVETSLRELDTDYIDVLFLHRDDITRDVETIMPVLDGLVKSGKVRMLGASNWTFGRIAAANGFATSNGLTSFSVSQIHHSLALTSPAQSDDLSHVIMDDVEYSWYQDIAMPVMAWSPAARGFFSKLAAGSELAERPAWRYGQLPENHRRAERVKQLASELNASVGAVVLAYLMEDDTVPTAAVCTFSKEQQFEEALEATRLTLSPAQRKFLALGNG